MRRKLLLTSEAALLLAVTRNTVTRWFRRRIIGGLRVGKVIRVYWPLSFPHRPEA